MNQCGESQYTHILAQNKLQSDRDFEKGYDA